MKSIMLALALLLAGGVVRADEIFDITFSTGSPNPAVFAFPSTDPLTVNASGSLGSFTFLGDTISPSSSFNGTFYYVDATGDILSLAGDYILPVPVGADPDYIGHPESVYFEIGGGIGLVCESALCSSQYGSGVVLGFGGGPIGNPFDLPESTNGLGTLSNLFPLIYASNTFDVDTYNLGNPVLNEGFLNDPVLLTSSITEAPEPGTLCLACFGLCLFIGYKRLLLKVERTL